MSELFRERSKLVKSMMQIDAELSGLRKSAPKRAELVRQKQRLIMEMQNLKIAKVADYAPNETITDHAVLRWLERKHGINIKRIRDLMLTDEVREAIDENQPQRRYWSDGDVVFVIEHGAVQTVIPVNALVEAEPQ